MRLLSSDQSPAIFSELGEASPAADGDVGKLARDDFGEVGMPLIEHTMVSSCSLESERERELGERLEISGE